MDNRTIEEIRENESKLINEIKQLEDKINKALDIAFEYSQIDGGHHKTWTIDQMVRALLDDKYENWVEKYMFGDKNPTDAFQSGEYYVWDTGIAP